jgi:molybdenum cofactor cytidylyltransferase
MQRNCNAGMSLARALRVERGAVVSFVGGGGKTTAMFRLASELSSAGMRVVTTTTTHISEDQARIAPASLHPDNLDQLGDSLDRFHHCLIVGPPDGRGRVCSISKELVADLHRRPDIDIIIVEADGSRSRPFKAPGEHEPVVPELTTILVPVVGLNVLGQPLNEDHVHRAEIISDLAKAQPGCPITSETIARILSHPRGGAKDLPAGARLVPLLNKADAHPDMSHASQIARNLLESANVDSVMISAMIEDPPVREVWSPVAGIVLAAGSASRFGATKQLLPWEETTLVAHCARTALCAGLDPVIVALGFDAENIAGALAGLPVQMIYNPEYGSGQSSSIRKALEALPTGTGAAVFLLADQPFVDAATIRAIVQAHRKSQAPACVPLCEGLRGNPVLFDKSLYSELRELSGDTGGRSLLEKYEDQVVSVPASRGILLDIDTMEDYKTLRKKAY